MVHNANIKLKDYVPKREIYMAEEKWKTTINERKEIVEYCMKQSMSRVGHCSIDNGPTEAFERVGKAETYYTRKFTDEVSLRKAVSDYINFYNNIRLQERFGDKPPTQVRAKALAADTSE